MSILLQARRHPYFIVIWAVITFMCSAEHAGFMLYLIAIPSLLYALIRTAVNWRKADVRNKYLLLIALILLSAAVVAAVHVQRHHHARSYADNIISELEKHRQAHGDFPASLDDIPTLASAESRPHMLFYNKGNDGPFLTYAATFVPFEAWHYDFSEKAWVYDYD
ncbi:hypothetical protein ACO0LF_18195 [Undibacterium sp. Di27W]|uniref:hypothetical protein n=1 Tax=Undibacterium sp. Di27W TaxID=3413036 RepID=UPI003BF4315E